MIRPAEGGEYPTLRHIQQRALDEPWPAMLELGVDGPPLVLVAETGRPVGYALALTSDDLAYLAELAVAPAEHCNGYGSELLEALLARLRTEEFDGVRLTARADDQRVQSFYQRFGFEKVERVPDHYEDGDAVVMAKSF